MAPHDEDHGTYAVRAVRAAEWASVRALTLLALRDPVAHLAFQDSYDVAAARPDAFWRERTANAAEGTAVCQFIAEEPGGPWSGMITILLEEPGTTDWVGRVVERRQGQAVGVYVRPERRGSGLARALLDTAVRWSAGRGLDRIRLLVHESNARARAFYHKAGFRPSGATVPIADGSGGHEVEYELTPPVPFPARA